MIAKYFLRRSSVSGTEKIPYPGGACLICGLYMARNTKSMKCNTYRTTSCTSFYTDEMEVIGH